MNKLNIRIESCNVGKYTYEVNHDLRIYNTQHIKNDNTNRLYIPNFKDLKKIKYKKNNKYDFRDDVFKKIDELKKKHNTLYKKNYKRNLRLNNTNSINMGILTFPSEFTPKKFNMDLKTFIETGIKTIENICTELDIELVYITCHLDETTPHFHFMTSNFDSKGNVIKRNRKTGIFLQDLSEIYFKDFGLERGVSKEITGLKNVKNEIQKKQKHNKDLTFKNNELEFKKQKLEDEINLLQKQKDTLSNEVKDLKQQQNSIWTQIKKMEEYFKKVKNDYIQYEDDVKIKREFYKETINPLISETTRLAKLVKFNISEINKVLTDENFIKRFNEINNMNKKLNQNNHNEFISNLLKDLIKETKPTPQIQKPKFEQDNYLSL